MNFVTGFFGWDRRYFFKDNWFKSTD